MDWLINLDEKLFLILNGFHSEFFDPIMVFASKIWVWFPLYIAIFVWLFIKKKWKLALIMLIFTAIAITLSDQLSVLIKDSVARFRPCEDPEIAPLTRVLEKRESLYGFVSGHACNSFCFALLSSLFVGKAIFTDFIFLWAGIVSYSRIYVGKHYPGDIIGGMLLGLLIGLVIYLLYQALVKHLERRYALRLK